MEKQDVNRAARTIRSLMREKKYKEVVKFAKTMRLDRINNGLLILDIVEAYEKLGNKKEAKETLLQYYDVHGITGRNMMQKLIELCIETKDIKNAVGLCMEFENEWPESSISYLMRYQIVTSAGGSLEERIYYLEKYKEADFEERWGYELAKLYNKNNQSAKCAEICHEIICFFGHGKYVEKAVQLKERTSGLTEDEINIVEAAKRRQAELNRQREEERLAREKAENEEAERRLREEEEQARLLAEQEEQRRQKEKEEQEKEAKRAAYEAAEAFREQEEEEAEAAAKKARKAEAEKIRQTEEAARLLREKKEKERLSREQKLAEAMRPSDRYAEVEKNKFQSIYFEDISRESEKGQTKQKTKNAQEGKGGIFSSFGRMASDLKKSLQPDEEYLEGEDLSGEVEYITVGRDTQAYAQDVEERMLSELDMLDDEQIEKLTSAQIKEIYELKVLRDVRENIKELIDETDIIYKTKTSEAELKRFLEKDPYPSLVSMFENEAADDMAEKSEPMKNAEETPEEEEKGKTETEEISEEEETEAEAEKTLEEEETEAEAEETPEEEEEAEEKAETEEVPEEIEVEAETEEMPEEIEVEVETEETSEEEEVEAETEETLEEEETEAEAEEMPKEEAEAEEMPKEEAEVEETEAEVEAEVEETPEEETEAEETPEETEAEETENESAEIESGENSEKKPAEEKKRTILDEIENADEDMDFQKFSECITVYSDLKGYRIEDTAYMTIAVLAEEMQQKNTPLSLNNAKKMVDDAIMRIQKRNPLDKIIDRYNKKHAYLLKDRHFYWKTE